MQMYVIAILLYSCFDKKSNQRYNIPYMEEIQKLKQELKQVNAEYAGIRDVPAEKRAEFGCKINQKKQEILAKIDENSYIRK